MTTTEVSLTFTLTVKVRGDREYNDMVRAMEGATGCLKRAAQEEVSAELGVQREAVHADVTWDDRG